MYLLVQGVSKLKKNIIVSIALLVILNTSPAGAWQERGNRVLNGHIDPSLVEICNYSHISKAGDKTNCGSWSPLPAGGGVEQFRLVTNLNTENAWLEYDCHVAHIGDWSTEKNRGKWLRSGETCGNESLSETRIEAYRIRVAGPYANQYTVEYDCSWKKRGGTPEHDIFRRDGAWCGEKGKHGSILGMRIRVKDSNNPTVQPPPKKEKPKKQRNNFSSAVTYRYICADESEVDVTTKAASCAEAKRNAKGKDPCAQRSPVSSIVEVRDMQNESCKYGQP